MNKQTLIFIVLLTIVVVLLGINFYTTPVMKKIQKVENEGYNLTATPEPTPEETKIDPMDELLNQLSDRQKVAQLIAYPVDAGELISNSKAMLMSKNLFEYQPGIITFLGQDISTESARLAVSKIDQIFADRELKPLIAVDHEGGRIQRLGGDGFTNLPSFRVACQQQPTELEEIYQQSARELSQSGINIIFGPVVDVARSNSPLGDRACTDLDMIDETASIFIKVFGKNQIMPTIKHYPGIGSAEKDLHNYKATVTLESEDKEAFSRILNRFPNVGVMTSHLRLRGVFDELPCSQSQGCIEPLNYYYPEAILFTDALDMESAKIGREESSLSDIAIRSIEAGNNVLVFGKGVKSKDLTEVLSDLVSEYQTNQGFKDQLDEALIKLLGLRINQQP